MANNKSKTSNSKPQDKRVQSGKPTKSAYREYAESLIIAAVIALVVRGFVVQAFRIPSGSMEPTLLIGDQLIVNRLSYVVKVPFTDIVLGHIGTPARGDVVVFRYPLDHSKDYIKRVIGIGGDVIEVKDKVIYLNGKPMKDPHAHYSDDRVFPAEMQPRDNFGPVTVPKDSYFCMGDNRDNSADSRYWGFVKTDELVGRALIVYFSFDSEPDNFFHYLRWERLGRVIR